MRLRAFLQKIRNNPYYREYVRICSLSSKECIEKRLHATVFTDRWENPTSNYASGNVRNYVLNRLALHIPHYKHNFLISYPSGMQFRVFVEVGVHFSDRHRFSRGAEIEATMRVVPLFGIHPDLFDYGRDILQYELSISLNEASLRKVADEYIKLRYFTEGLMSRLQMKYKVKKNLVIVDYEYFYRGKFRKATEYPYSQYTDDEEKRIRLILKKRYNLVDSLLHLQDTVRVINNHSEAFKTGKPIRILAYNFEQAYSFDGCDPDKLMNLLNGDNPPCDQHGAQNYYVCQRTIY